MTETPSRENHFVPKFYLRNFSEDGKRMNLFNFSRRQAIEGVSIKHQCSRRNFYGFFPRMEQAFADLECKAAKVIRGIRARADIPSESSDDWALLLKYMLFQKLRTTNTGRASKALTDYAHQLLFENNTESADEESNGAEAKVANSVMVPLLVAPDILPIASDLRAHLFTNATGREFITSDDPVVTHNQYCEGIDYQGVRGWNSSGLQVFWPLSPHELIVFYDHQTYVIGRSKRERRVTKLFDERDIAQLNSLQILNAHHNVYFAGIKGFNKAKSECNGIAPRRPQTRMRFVETEAVETGVGESSAILHCYDPLLPVALRVSKIKIHKDRLEVPLHRRAQMYRKFVPRTEQERATYVNPKSGTYAVKKITNM